MTPQDPSETLLALSFANVAARALHVVAEAGVADALINQPRSSDDLAAETGLDSDSLARLLRLLEEHGVFRRDHSGCWTHTEASRLLRSDHPRSMRSFSRMAGTPLCWESLTHLDHAARTGQPGIKQLDPGGTFSYLAAHPDQREIFQAAMTSKSHADIAAALAAHDFSQYATICDVGGGRGHLLHAILQAHERVRGVLFDLPEVAAGVQPHERFDTVRGDFFIDKLPKADTYVLMDVIHDWDDKAATEILSAVHDAGQPQNATILVIESIMPEGPEPHWSKTLDIVMLTVTGGRERTLNDHATLFAAAGIELVALTPTATSFSIVQARIG